MKYQFWFLILFPLISFSQKLEKLLIDSDILGRQIEVFVLDKSKGIGSPLFYFTDGKKMIENGTSVLIDSLTKNELIPNAKYIFVSTIDPHTLVDYRDEYFFCNENYVDFFEKELIPMIEGSSKKNQLRYLIGVSFGGMNAAYFAAKSSQFKGFAMLSPITYPCAEINQSLVFSEYKGYKAYLSTGIADAEHYVETLYPMLKLKTDKVKLVKTQGGHDFENWNKQILNIITFMYE